MRHCRWLCWLLPAAVLFGLPVPARGDDWGQFRKDAEHSGAAKDPVKLPLAEIWTWTRQYPSGSYYNMNAAVFQGRVFFISKESKQRFLVCADARTGVVIWKQTLVSPTLNNMLSDDVAPAVGPDGTVYVYDLTPLPRLASDISRGGELFTQVFVDNVSGTDVDAREKLRASLVHYARGYFGFLPGLPDPPPGLRITKHANGSLEFSGSVPIIRNLPSGQAHIEKLGVSITVTVGPTFTVRTFSALDGKPGPFVPLDPWLNTESVNYTLLLHPPYPHGYTTLPSSNDSFLSNVGLGPPALLGSRLIATTTDSAVVDWSPGNRLTGGAMLHTLIHHPVPGWEPFYTPLAALGGFPPLPSSSGILVGDDSRNRFLSLLGVGAGASDWHVDIRGALGIPAAKGGMTYLGVLGNGATRAIICLNPGSGTIEWRYAPTGMQDDPQKIGQGQWFGQGGKIDKNSRRVPLGHRRVQLHTQKGEPLQFEDRKVSMVIPDLWSVSGPGGFEFASVAAHSWDRNPGLAVTDDTVYGVASQEVVALERGTGTVRWRVPLARGMFVKSLIVSGQYLFLTTFEKFQDWPTPVPDRQAITALRLKDGKKVWGEAIPEAGTLIAANGLVFMSNGTLHAYGPAERTFRMAVDSEAKEDYLLHPLPDPQPDEPDAAADAKGPDGQQPGGEASKPEALPANGSKTGNDAGEQKPAPPMREMADATVLRLSASEPVEQLVARCKARRELLPGLPMLVTLDPFNATRESWLRFSDHPVLSAEWNASYAEICAKVAAAGRPEFLEALPEVNAYLVRDLDRLSALKALVRAVMDAVHAASPETKVVVSLNAEVLNTSYSRGDYRPFGKLPAADERTLKPSMELAVMADAVGLTAYPQSGAIRSADVPSGYLTNIRQRFGKKPMLVTRLAMIVDEALEPKVPGVQLEQATLLHRLLQNCYWLDAPIVAYPEVIATEKSAPLALRKADGDRAALGVWQRVLRWKRVDKLTLLKTEHEKEEEAPAPAAANAN